MEHRKDGRRDGVALVMAISAVAILTVVLADMHESTSTAHAIATNERDSLRAEYMAKSGLNLTRLLVAQEPQIRRIVTPMFQLLVGRPPPMLPVWSFANELLAPFCDYKNAKENSAAGGIDWRNAEGLDHAPGTCEVVSFAENSKINVNQPLTLGGDVARRSVAMQLFALTGGYQAQSAYDPLFSKRDADGQFTSRQDVISAFIDWWDQDTQRSVFDPGAGSITQSGGEDNIYQRLDSPYEIKNAPFDSLEEIRLIRGVSDDFWASLVEPEPGNPTSRAVTVYGSGAVNANEAPASVLLARICSFLDGQPLCDDPTEGAKFVQLVSTVRGIIPVPFFSRRADFLNFIEGKGGPRDLYPMLKGFLGEDSGLVFRPVNIPDDQRRDIERSFVTGARILSIHSTGLVGRAEVRIQSVMNFHERWTPPPPNAGRMTGLGIFHHYRVD